ncbi:cell division protein ZapE [Acidomonas methanolica]|uniref:Chaperone of cytochrome c oxidases n=1 Tax=Acidomonas methanolica NBRC 104435 TaxID=1231351 RepID=A0A023D8P5_ACIMT|nr:cell division protein ZapE [Acidomonas methanolica]MBU2655131.1 cell division protein ZapE [Acidomonas methanolica]TCS25168.1 cell division protein ZapE [Acidomonas methanolica]GAJ30105.1 chaperone of cytochrome c oxidases [Acidomonas methanolica NBRC 104435]GBQ49334.1 putative ATPase [Acidomonas methanolica]GEK99663.1 cell division protein ZapE [Acidomonas methanolica NBRC 104435]
MSFKLVKALMPANATLSEAYAAGVRDGLIQHDDAQAQAARALDALAVRLTDKARETSGAKGLLARFSRSIPVLVDGVYLVGEVGRGKSMLMDMFFELVPVQKKRRIHFHAFMQECHKALHAIQRLPRKPDDPVADLAEKIAERYSLICFDEFQMHDMSDAVVILRLLNMLIELGVTFVATSNTEPENLLKGHQGRVVMLPYIRAFARHMQVVLLQSARDYRRGREDSDEAWLIPADAEARAKLDAIFAKYATEAPAPAELSLGSRSLHVPQAGGKVARFSFDDLCANMYGPGDFIRLADAYPVIIIDGIPRLDPDRYDIARRFITLIDVLYERHTLLFVSAACWPESLYEAGENARIFERTASRLDEMRSDSWQIPA